MLYIAPYYNILITFNLGEILDVRLPIIKHFLSKVLVKKIPRFEYWKTDKLNANNKNTAKKYSSS